MRILLLLMLLQSVQLLANDKYQFYRKNLALASNDKALCFSMMEELVKHKNDEKAKGYLGAYTMISANHVFSPIQKLKSFNKGKDALEKSIVQLPKDVELRYVRYAIQISIPKFLGYKNNIQTDKKWMMEQLQHSDKKLQTDIRTLLKLN